MTSKATKRRHTESEGAKPRQRRKRTAFTDEQLDRLEEIFREEKFPGITLRTDLANELGIREDRIQVWFQNRRARWRKREIKNKPAPLQPGFMSPTPYQTSATQAAFPPLRPSHQTTVTWAFPVPYSRSATLGYGFPPQTPALSPWTSTPLQHFPRSTVTSAVTQPPVFPRSLYHVKAADAINQTDCGSEKLSSDEFNAAVTLVNAFNREQ